MTFHDVVLDLPFSHAWLRGLLFFTFFIHFVFVLLTIGTAVLGVTWYVRSHFGEEEKRGWDRDILVHFFAYKSLAIVFGVGPLLLMQVGNTVPFFTALNLLAPLWMGIIVLLVAALVLIEVLAERGSVTAKRRGLYLAIGTLGLACLVAVPGIFAAILATTEQPGLWTGILTRGSLPSGLTVHWLLRYAHVLGAAVVFGSAFAWFRLPVHAPQRRTLLGWVFGGLLVQFVLGVALFATLDAPPQAFLAVVLVLGIGTAAFLAWGVYRATTQGLRLSRVLVLSTSLVTVLLMLLVRQGLQDRVMVPLAEELLENGRQYQALLVPHRAYALGSYEETKQIAYNEPLTIWSRSCGFCHGAVANGQGPAASDLRVPPEDLTGVRTTRAELRRIMAQGVPGTGMPYFTIYTRDELNGLFDLLEKMGLMAHPESVYVTLTREDRYRAGEVWADTCSACHGIDGRGTELASGFLPPPPNLTVLSYGPGRAFEVITDGYPGTLMRSYAHLDEGTRWALVDLAQDYYRANAAPTPAVGEPYAGGAGAR